MRLGSSFFSPYCYWRWTNLRHTQTPRILGLGNHIQKTTDHIKFQTLKNTRTQ